MRVGLFDSGIGGLTVLKTLKSKFPNNDYIYYGDTLNVPYGNKSKDELLELSKHNVDFLISKKVDIIIIACGTVSSNCLDELKKIYDTPIYSIILPTIEYLNNSNYHDIGVIATHATINSHIFKDNIKKNVYEIETPKLVPLIENNDDLELDIALTEYLAKYNNKLDILVLGCTHYPIIKDKIRNILNNTVLLDMSEIINIDNDGNGNIQIYFSKLSDNTINNTKRILNSNDININLC